MSSSVIRGRVRKRSYASLQAEKPVNTSSKGSISAEPTATESTNLPHVLLPDWYYDGPTHIGDIPVDVLEAAVLQRVEALAAPTGADAALSLDLLASEKRSTASGALESSSTIAAATADASASLTSPGTTTVRPTREVAWDGLTHLTLRMAIAAAAGADHPTVSALKAWWVSTEARVFLGRLRRWLVAKEGNSSSSSSSVTSASSSPHDGHPTEGTMPEFKEWWREYGLRYSIVEVGESIGGGLHESSNGGHSSMKNGGSARRRTTTAPPLVAVPFEHAASLVARRAVKLQRGMALILWTEMPMVVAGRFRTHLNQQVNTPLNQVKSAEHATALRIITIINGLHMLHS